MACAHRMGRSSGNRNAAAGCLSAPRTGPAAAEAPNALALTTCGALNSRLRSARSDDNRRVIASRVTTALVAFDLALEGIRFATSTVPHRHLIYGGARDRIERLHLKQKRF